MEPANPAERREGQCPLYLLAKEVLIRGFLESKLIKHASDGYPKVARDSSPHSRHRRNRKEIDYGLEETTVIQPNQAGQQPQALQPQSENPLQGFGEQPQSGTDTRIWYNSPNITRR